MVELEVEASAVWGRNRQMLNTRWMEVGQTGRPPRIGLGVLGAFQPYHGGISSPGSALFFSDRKYTKPVNSILRVISRDE